MDHRKGMPSMGREQSGLSVLRRKVGSSAKTRDQYLRVCHFPFWHIRYKNVFLCHKGGQGATNHLSGYSYLTTELIVVLYVCLFACLIDSSFLSVLTKTRGNDTNMLVFNQNTSHNTAFWFSWMMHMLTSTVSFHPSGAACQGTKGNTGQRASRLTLQCHTYVRENVDKEKVS